MSSTIGVGDELVFLADVSPYRDADGRLSPAGVHRSLGACAVAFAQVATMCGLGYRSYSNVADLDEDILGRARVLVLYTIGETPWSQGQRRTVEARAASGALGLLGVHSATDSAYGWPAFGDLIGARFNGHPFTGDLALRPLVADHPATAHLPSPWRVHEELYLFRDLSPKGQVLLGVEFPGSGPGAALLPLCWCIEDGHARSFYTVVGHFLRTYEDAAYLSHLLGAVNWLTRAA